MKLSQLRKLIKEEIEKSESNDIDLTKLVDAAESEFKKELSTAVSTIKNKVNDTKNINEAGGALFAVGIGLALPALLGLATRMGKKMSQLVKKVIGSKPENENDVDKWLDNIGKAADMLHHSYLVPIEAIVKRFVKDPKRVHKISNIILHTLVAICLYTSGAGAIKAFSSKNYSLATLETILSAIKSGELKEFLIKHILDGAENIH